MKKKLLSASVIAGMKINGLPETREGLRVKAEREGWYSEEVTGRGGKQKVYAIPARYLGGTESSAVAGTSASTADNIVQINTGHQMRLLEIGKAVDLWLLENNRVMDLDKKYVLIELLDSYFRLDQQVDKEKMSDMLSKLA